MADARDVKASELETDPWKRAPSKADASKGYLAIYNLLSAILWATIFVRIAVNAPYAHPQYIMETMGNFTKLTQTLALLEIGHSVFGIVRAPLFTTLLQVASRIMMVWGIWQFFPNVPAENWPLITMVLAWSATETIRYSYFFGQLGGFDAEGGTPQWLTWLRYNTFFVLYPMGISSECWLIWKSVPFAERYYGREAAYGLYAILAGYVPGAFILYTHMMSQRAKVMKKQRAVKKAEKKSQ